MSNVFNPFIGVTKIISAEVSGKFAELQTKVDNIQSKGYDDTQLRNSIQQLSSAISGGIVVDAYTKLETNNLLSTKVNVSDFNEYKEQVSSELSSIVDNDTIYDDTQIKADISELSSKLENLEITGEIYDDTQLRNLISTETENRILEDTSLSSQIEILNLEKGDDYTAFEVFPHNFSLQAAGSIISGTQKTVGEMFSDWRLIQPGMINKQDTNNYLNRLYKFDGEYKRFHPVSGYISITQQKITDASQLPQIGDINVFYEIDANNRYFYFDEAIRNLRNGLTTAADTDLLFKIKANTKAVIRFRTKLSTTQVDEGKSDVIIDWGDNTYSKFSEYTTYTTNSWHAFIHEYSQQNINKNHIIKIYGKDYYCIDWQNSGTPSIVSRAFDYDLPVASHLKNFSNFFITNLVYKVDFKRCTHSFEECNVASMFINTNIQHIHGLNLGQHQGLQNAFVSLYSMNCMFQKISVLNDLEFVFPAYTTYANGNNYTQYCTNVFQNIYFNYGKEAFDILTLFGQFSFSQMPKGITINVAGMFNSCKNITCSNVEKLGKFLWNNPNINWTNTSSVFGNVTADFLSGVPVEWGGTLIGWTAPTQLTQEYVDNKDNLLINDIVELSSKLDNLVDNDTIYDDTQIKADIVELSSKLENLEITGEIYDDTQLRNLISAETENRILEDTSLSSEIEILNLEKGDDYTAFEVFPHNFSFANPSNFNNGVVKTVGEMFGEWQKVTSATYKEQNVGSMNIMYRYGYNLYKRFHPFDGYIDLTIEEVTSLPEKGQKNILYKIDTNYYLYYDEAIRNLRNCLTTAKDDDIFFGMDSSDKLIIRLRTKLTLQEVDADKSDVLIDWGDGTQTKFKDYTTSGSWYDFEHEYSEEYMNKNCVVKIFGKDYYFINFKSTTTSSNGNGIVIITRMFDYDLPIASHLNIFSNINTNNLIYRIDASKCKRSFDCCNIASMFTTPNIQQIRGFSDNSKEFAFNSIYCMNYMFNGVKHIKTIDFKFPALCKLPIFQYVFNGVYFNYGDAPYDILNLFNNFSFSLMPENEPVDIAGMFNNCKNITCSNYQKLGNYLWNNSKVNWTNTSGVFKGCPDDLRANIPVEWGGTLTGWTAPERLTKEYVDNNITQLQETINSLTDNDTIYDDTEIRNEISGLQNQINQLQISGGIYDNTGIVQQISIISSEIQQLNTIIKTDGAGTKFLADDGNYYQIITSKGENSEDITINTPTQVLDINALSTYLDENGYLQVVPAEFITETQLKQKNYIDEQYLATNNYINQQYLTQQEYMRSLDIYEHPVVLELIEHINTLYTRITQLSEKIQITETNVQNNLISVVWDQQESNTDSTSGQII